MAGHYQLIRERYRQEGTVGFVKLATSTVRQNPAVLVEPVYQLFKPNWTTLSTAGKKVELAMDTARFSNYDFRDDFESEKAILRSFLRDLKVGDHVWDVGANVGIYSCFAGVSANVSIEAYEPHPEIADILRKNLERNQIVGVVHELALSDVNKYLELAEVGQTAHNLAQTGEHATISVQGFSGDYLLAEEVSRPPNAIKIDVEGAELRVIKGLQNLFTTTPPRVVYLEEHADNLPKFGDSVGDLRSFLQDNGYNIEVLGKRDENTFIRATW